MSYINREALIAEYDRVHIGKAGGARKLMVDAPTADVVEARHGEWIHSKTYYDADECNCSLCGQLMTTAKGIRKNYCPNCGAKMDKEKDDIE